MERIVTNWGRHHSKGCRFQNPFIARVIIDTREKGTGEQPVEGLSTFGKNSLTSTGTKEAVRWVRQKSIGLQPKRPSARTCWLQELNSDQTTGCIAEQGSGGVPFGEIGHQQRARAPSLEFQRIPFFWRSRVRLPYLVGDALSGLADLPHPNPPCEG